MKKFMFAFTFAVLSLPAFSAVTAEHVFQIINERLQYMQDVAAYKANHHLPIEDITREEVVVDKAKQAAEDQGLNPESVESFFQAQISAAKAIQYRYRADFLSQPIQQKPRDLKAEVRPALLTLGNQIIEGIAEYQQQSGSFTQSQYELFTQKIDVQYLSESDKRQLFDALLKIKTN